MKKILYIIALFLLASSLKAQHDHSRCGFIIPKKKPISNKFASVYEAADYIREIIKAVNWKENFTIERVYGTNNAEATIKNNERYILYDNEFCENIDYQTGTKWASISILAHEVGHHYYGHVFTGQGSTPPTELEADFFSGYAMAKLGASLENAKSAAKTLRPEGSDTHPPRNERLRAITRGWNKAQNNTNDNGGGNSSSQNQQVSIFVIDELGQNQIAENLQVEVCGLRQTIELNLQGRSKYVTFTFSQTGNCAYRLAATASYVYRDQYGRRGTYNITGYGEGTIHISPNKQYVVVGQNIPNTRNILLTLQEKQ